MRRCEECGAIVPVHDQVCMSCGKDLDYPEEVFSTQSLMRAVDAIMECLKAEGVEHVFGIPGGANLPTYDALYDAGVRHIQCRHEQGAGPRGRGLRQGVGPGRSRAGHVRPGRDQPDHADRRRDDGLGPDRLPHRPGAHRPARHRRLPGGRHPRHDDAGRQALAADPGPARHPARDPRGVPHRPHRAARARCSWTSRRTSRAPTSRTSRPRDVAAARLPADDGGQRQADPAGGEGARERAPPRDLRRRRRGQRRRGEGADRARPVRPLPGHVHADGPGRLPGAARAVDRHARHARHARGQLRDGRGRPDLSRSAPASTTASPASCRSSRRGRSSSTSTSTRPRSRRTCRRTSRSSATPSRSCPS